MQSHGHAVQRIADRVKTFYNDKRPFRIYHGSTNSTRKSQYTQDNTIDISKLNNVLAIDTNKKTILVEPNVPMEVLVAKAMEAGLIPPVVMEFVGITAGGGFSGTSGESSSLRHGFFEDTVVSVEIVLGNGEIVRADHKGAYRDLLKGTASAFGTLGVITMLEISLIPAPKYVEVTYRPVIGAAHSIELFNELQADLSVEYLDGILFSRKSGVVMSGRGLAENVENLPVRRFTAPADPWFYLHAQKQMQTGSSTNPKRDVVPLVDYLFRYNRGSFWAGKYTFIYFLIPFTDFTRRIFDSFVTTRAGFHRLHTSGLADKIIIQDIAVPYDKTQEYVDYVEKSWGWYPLWLCPLLIKDSHDTIARPMLQSYSQRPESERFILNLGIWGPGPGTAAATTKLNLELELKAHALGGMKWLYGNCYCNATEFWKVYYDKQKYDALREKYGAQHLPTVFDKLGHKVHKTKTWREWWWSVFLNTWPLGGLYATLMFLVEEEYLLKRKPEVGDVGKRD